MNLKRGDKIKDFRGEEWIFLYFSNDRKVVVKKDGKPDYDCREFYKEVFKLWEI